MPPKPSPNFAYLAHHDARLVALATQAEEHFAGDPTVTLFKLRRFSEVLAQRAAANCNLFTSRDERQEQLVDRLFNRNVIGANQRSLSHDLRKAGNQAVHHSTGTHAEALHQRRGARERAVWFQRSFGNHRRFDPGPFIPPPEPKRAGPVVHEDLERSRREMEAQQKELEAAQRAIEEAKKTAEAEFAEKPSAKRRALKAAEEAAFSEALANEHIATHREAAKAEATRSAALEEHSKKLLAELMALKAAARAKPAEQLSLTIAHAREASESVELDEATTRCLIDQQLREAFWEVDSQRLKYERGVRPTKGKTLVIAELPTCHDGKEGRADYVLFAGLEVVGVVEAKRRHKGRDRANATGQAVLPRLPRPGRRILAGGKPAGRARGSVLVRNERSTGPTSDPHQEWHLVSGRAPPQEPSRPPRGMVHARRAPRPFEAGRRRSARKAEGRADAVHRPRVPDARHPRCRERARGGPTRTSCCHGNGHGQDPNVHRVLLPAAQDQAFSPRAVPGGLERARQAEVGRAQGPAAREPASFHRYPQCEGARRSQARPRNQAPDRDGPGHGPACARPHDAAAEPDIPPVDHYDDIVVDECHRGYLLDRELSDREFLFRDEADYISRYRRVLDHFDAVKIGLPATPALHTTEIFGAPVYSYSYREAAVDGFLVTHEPPIRVVTDLAHDGVHHNAHEEVLVLDRNTQTIQKETLEHEVQFEVDAFSKRVITEHFNRAGPGELVKHVDPEEDGKTLIFCATDEHADTVVLLLKEVLASQYGSVDDDAVAKTTGATDCPLEAIRLHRNERHPNIAVTVGQVGISGGDHKDVPVPLPPLNEQRRIVAKLEALHARTRRAREALHFMPPLLEKLRQSILATAFRGDLTKDWRAKHEDVEPAKELLKRIRAERRKKGKAAELAKMKAKGKAPGDDRWKARYVEPEPAELTGLPALPDGWCWSAWREVRFCQNVRAFLSAEYSNAGMKLLRPGNLHVSGELEWNEANAQRMPLKWATEFREFIVNTNELVMNLTAQSLIDEFLGRTYRSGPTEEYLLNHRLGRLTPLALPARYWLWFLKSPYSRRYVDTLNTGSLIRHMFTSQLDACVVPLMPVEEAQTLVESHVDARMSTVRAIDTLVRAQSGRLSTLEQSALDKAFRGELVPQGPNDEPVETAFARARQTRDRQTESKPARKRPRAEAV